MSKKKSYMDNKNIVKEGFFDTLVRAIIPKSIQDKVDANAKKYHEKESKKLDKKLQDLEKESAKLSDIIAKELEKQYGYKTNKKKISDFIGKRK
tara:strand:- start:1159 stop:1440 length:282 start_codon:yes stop_codon:yes gene_type:complete